MNQQLNRCLGLHPCSFHGLRCHGFPNEAKACVNPFPRGAFECQVNAQILQGSICVPMQASKAFARVVGFEGKPMPISVSLWENTGDEGLVPMRLVFESSHLRLCTPTFSLAAICLRGLYRQWAKVLSAGGSLPKEALGTYLHVEPRGTGDVRITCFGGRPSRPLALSSIQWERLKAYASLPHTFRNRHKQTRFPDVTENPLGLPPISGA